MSSGFITETELSEIRKQRQEQWEKVRNADDPIERPEEVFDKRSLFERLQEQKQKKDLEYEEAHKLKNMIKGLDDDEIEFLDLVDRTKVAADRKKELEEAKELHDYRNRVAQLQEKAIEDRLQADIVVNKTKTSPVSVKQSSQQKLLKGIVVVKKQDAGNKKRKMSDSPDNGTPTEQKQQKTTDNGSKVVDEKGDKRVFVSDTNSLDQGAFKCVAILPGLGCYDDSSSTDDNSSDSEVENEVSLDKTDLVGRVITAVTKKIEKSTEN